MSTYQKGQPVWTWRVGWTDALDLDTKVLHGTIREITDDTLQLLPDGARAEPSNIIHCHTTDVFDTKEAAYRGLLDWLHKEYRERTDTLRDCQKEACSLAAAKALNRDKLYWLTRKQKKG